jgi:acyl dehydratase
VNVDEELPQLTRVVTRDDIRAYADVSGDRNALHLDDDVARQAGFDGLIAHGMFTMAHMATCVVEWAGTGSFVERISAHFRATVGVGDTIVAGGRVRAIEGDRATVDAWVQVRRDGQTEWPVRKGEVVLKIRG